jgi:hypothetical protein
MTHVLKTKIFLLFSILKIVGEVYFLSPPVNKKGR